MVYEFLLLFHALLFCITVLIHITLFVKQKMIKQNKFQQNNRKTETYDISIVTLTMLFHKLSMCCSKHNLKVVLLKWYLFCYTSLWPVLPNPRFRRLIGLLLTFTPRPAKPCCYFATFGLLFSSWSRNVFKSGVFVKNCQFPVNSGEFWTFSTSVSRFIVNW